MTKEQFEVLAPKFGKLFKEAGLTEDQVFGLVGPLAAWLVPKGYRDRIKWLDDVVESWRGA